MKDALILLVFAAACYPKLLAQPAAASLQGTVVVSTTGAPLAKVHLNLSPSNPDEVPAPAYGAISDDAGHFSMAAIQPGVEYRLQAERTGYIEFPTVAQAPSSVIVMTLKPGEHIAGYRIEMAPRAVITGRVLDENGEPAPNFSVIAMRVPQSLPTHSASPGISVTDSRGAFRIAVAPGNYYIAGDPTRREIRLDGSVEPPYVRTYYPSALDRASAVAVEAPAGGIVNGIDIRLLRSAMLHIRGTLSGAQGAVLRLVILKNSAGAVEEMTTPEADGQFSFSPLEPGNYRLYGTATGPDGPLSTPVVDLKLTTASLDFVPLALSHGFDLAGTLSGIAPAGHDVRLTVVRAASDPMPIPGGTAIVAADGSFVLKGMQPGEYEVEISNLPDNAYIQRIRLGPAVAEDGVIDLRGGSTSNTLALTVNPNGAQIAGILEAPNGAAVRQRGHVDLVEEGKDWRQRHIHGAETDSDGQFTVEGLAPGKYRFFAYVYGLTPLPPGAERTTTMQKYAADAESIEVHDGEKIARNAKVAGIK